MNPATPPRTPDAHRSPVHEPTRGQEAAIEYRCYRAERCVGWERVDGEQVGAPINASRGLCPDCERVVEAAIAQLPEDYVRLSLRLGRSGGAGGGTPVACTPEVQAPLNLHVEALMAEMCRETSTWAESVAEVHGRRRDTQRDARTRPGVLLQGAAQFLVYAMPAFLALRNAEHLVWQDGHLEPDPKGDKRMRLDGQLVPARWVDGRLEATERDGLDGALLLLELHRRATALLGQTKKTRRLPEPCSACGLQSLVHADGADTVECRNCAVVITWDDYQAANDLTGGAAA
ncbi:hypothetical protein [Goodfellowiella coeruleoviolacea]|uniref:Uncharacterized protein n=1 Tax=Goodfellowiella coeruleoviolacea TaxID=334858 RepID=A0AAE3GIS5_9PSEU|nr:hypothetical protein [Goodfellowiella coeruleoviolacea]MCP2168119.1 hypothetical protein [Goodfellowiella coeruleoviolacea]